MIGNNGCQWVKPQGIVKMKYFEDTMSFLEIPKLAENQEKTNNVWRATFFFLFNMQKLFCFVLVCCFFYLGFLSRTFTNHRTTGEGGGHFFNSSLPLPPASQTFRHQLGDYCIELTSSHSQQPNLNREPLASERKLLTTKLLTTFCLKNITALVKRIIPQAEYNCYS